MQNILSDILNMDPRIHYVGAIDRAGNILNGKYKAGADPVFSPDDLERFAVEVALRRRMRQEWDKSLGDVVSTVVARDKITTVTLYVGEKTLLILLKRGAPLGMHDPVGYLRLYLSSIEGKFL